ncbi:MAG: aminopeptidase [Calditrichaeota bacterium]|nr:MAG: aminopeptidase [Calditrichota bacterium]
MRLLKKCAEVAVRDCLRVKKDEDLLIIIDESLFEIGSVFWEIGSKYAKNAFLIQMAKSIGHGVEPPEKIANLMKEFPAIIIPTTFSISHTKAVKDACASGARIATLPSIKRSVIERTMNADYNEIAKLTNYIAEQIEISETVTVTSASGTNLTFSVEGQKVFRDTGVVCDSGQMCNLPAGEVYFSPKKGTVNGKIVVDGSMYPIGRIENPIEITFIDGFATEIVGDFEADLLRKAIEPYGKNATYLAEFGLGTNYKASFSGNVIEDEKAMGTFHFAIGNDTITGGGNNVACHLTGIALKTSFVTDKIQITQEGQIVAKP